MVYEKTDTHLHAIRWWLDSPSQAPSPPLPPAARWQWLPSPSVWEARLWVLQAIGRGFPKLHNSKQAVLGNRKPTPEVVGRMAHFTVSDRWCVWSSAGGPQPWVTFIVEFPFSLWHCRWGWEDAGPGAGPTAPSRNVTAKSQAASAAPAEQLIKLSSLLTCVMDHVSCPQGSTSSLLTKPESSSVTQIFPRHDLDSCTQDRCQSPVIPSLRQWSVRDPGWVRQGVCFLAHCALTRWDPRKPLPSLWSGKSSFTSPWLCLLDCLVTAMGLLAKAHCPLDRGLHTSETPPPSGGKCAGAAHWGGRCLDGRPAGILFGARTPPFVLVLILTLVPVLTPRSKGARSPEKLLFPSQDFHINWR